MCVGEGVWVGGSVSDRKKEIIIGVVCEREIPNVCLSERDT